MGYRITPNPWQVYSKPFSVKTTDKERAKAVRYGWQESEGSLADR